MTGGQLVLAGLCVAYLLTMAVWAKVQDLRADRAGRGDAR